MAPCMHQVAPLKCVRFTSEFVSFSVRRTTWCFMCSKCFVLFGSLLFSNCWFLLKRNPRWWFEKYVTHLGEMIQMDWIHLNLGSFRFWRPKNHGRVFRNGTHAVATRRLEPGRFLCAQVGNGEVGNYRLLSWIRYDPWDEFQHIYLQWNGWFCWGWHMEGKYDVRPHGSYIHGMEVSSPDVFWK